MIENRNRWNTNIESEECSSPENENFNTIRNSISQQFYTHSHVHRWLKIETVADYSAN